MVIYSDSDGGPHLGYLYTVGNVDDRVQLPSINIAFAKDLYDSIKNGANVTVEIGDTGTFFRLLFSKNYKDYNPWLWLGESAAGVLFQVIFELYAAAALGLAIYRSYGFFRSQGMVISVTQSILFIEMIAAICTNIFAFRFL